MSDRIHSLALIIFFFLMAVIIGFFLVMSGNVRVQNDQLQQLVKTAVYKNVDNSARAKLGTYYLNYSGFYDDLNTSIKSLGGGGKIESVSFMPNDGTGDSYTITPTGSTNSSGNPIVTTNGPTVGTDSVSVLAVKVVSYVNGTEYTTRYAISKGDYESSDITDAQQGS